MDTLRSNSRAYEPSSSDIEDAALDEDCAQDEPCEAPPPAIGTNERRMQVRAYNFWASQLADRNFPSIADLRPDDVGDFGCNAVLLDFSKGSEDPRIGYLGAELAKECDVGGKEISRLSDVPSRSLLSRITDHYMQILANQAPIGFEAEFVNQRGATILYRGILLPYSSDDTVIDFIYGVINWKELADQEAADELLLEIDQALETAPLRRRSVEHTPIADWADGPGGSVFDNAADADLAEIAPVGAWNTGATEIPAIDELSAEPANDAAMALADWLARAREQADTARDREDRTRAALYEAIGRAWDFALAAADAPDDFAEMLADSGLTRQKRAPMTPIVKLVFGVDYDKTRLTEYAAALAHAQRMGLPRGTLAEFLRNAEGGLKGVINAERRLRREEAGKPPREIRSAPRKAIVKKLRAIAPQDFGSLASHGDEFALVMVRRDAGKLCVLGEIPGDASLIEKAARNLLG